ncbi:MAG: antitoxin [Thermodesulfobacteriota bacterium]
MARTTIDIDTPILEEIRAIQKREKRSMGKIVTQLLSEALAVRKSPSKPPTFKWVTKSMNAQVDLSDKDALYAILDKESK